MWQAKSILPKLPQLKSQMSFVEETLIVSAKWKVFCDTLHHVENDLKFSAKLEVKNLMFHNVQGEYRV